MNVLGLFSGIGGFELGFERAGFNISAMCEIEPYCRAVLKKHWPRVPVYEDVRELTAERLRLDGIAVDVITGGFPCQDISLAGKGAGLTGERSGLWFEYRRVIEEVRPPWVVIENVSALRSRGLDTVLRQLTEIGYDAEWHCIPASAVGAPHRRDRIWIIASLSNRYGTETHSQRTDAHRIRPYLSALNQQGNIELRNEQDCDARSICSDVPHANGQGQYARAIDAEMGSASESMADAHNERAHGRRPCGTRRHQPENGGSTLADAKYLRRNGNDWWQSEPDVGRVANGVPSRVDRLRALGNAVVPQIPEIIARAILTTEKARSIASAA